MSRVLQRGHAGPLMPQADQGSGPDQVRAAARDPQGKYANYFDVGVNANELVIDFGQFYGRGTQPTVHTRIVTTAAYGRELLGMLTRSMRELESHTLALQPPNPDDRSEGSQS
jgi:hypothetical protein